MTQLTSYYTQRRSGLHIATPDGMRNAIAAFLKMALDAIENDLLSEEVSSPLDLKEGNFLLDFYQRYKEDFLGFAAFVTDYQGWYDARLYRWQEFTPFVQAVFSTGLEMPCKSRLIEISGQYPLARLALADDNVALYVLTHWSIYASLDEKYEDAHGRACNILEDMHTRLQNMPRPFEPGTPQWALEILIKRYLYNL
ncbi:MAG: hypothetical protein IJ870_01920 [Alphaproteobacteria bacterium]|nr:hypothetical protein [Alphaproteobacteria bacterium]